MLCDDYKLHMITISSEITDERMIEIATKYLNDPNLKIKKKYLNIPKNKFIKDSLLPVKFSDCILIYGKLKK